MSFWPDEINADEVLSPIDILEDAARELENRTAKLSVTIRDVTLEDRIVLSFRVRNKDTRAVLNLFEANHPIGQSYPVVIDPPAQELPDFLKRRRYEAGLVEPGMGFGLPLEGRYVENRWYCATPSEFRKKLTELFKQDRVLTRIISLLAPITSSEVLPEDDSDFPDGDPDDPGDLE